MAIRIWLQGRVTIKIQVSYFPPLSPKIRISAKIGQNSPSPKTYEMSRSQRWSRTLERHWEKRAEIVFQAKIILRVRPHPVRRKPLRMLPKRPSIQPPKDWEQHTRNLTALKLWRHEATRQQQTTLPPRNVPKTRKFVFVLPSLGVASLQNRCIASFLDRLVVTGTLP